MPEIYYERCYKLIIKPRGWLAKTLYGFCSGVGKLKDEYKRENISNVVVKRTRQLGYQFDYIIITSLRFPLHGKHGR